MLTAVELEQIAQMAQSADSNARMTAITHITKQISPLRLKLKEPAESCLKILLSLAQANDYATLKQLTLIEDLPQAIIKSLIDRKSPLVFSLLIINKNMQLTKEQLDFLCGKIIHSRDPFLQNFNSYQFIFAQDKLSNDWINYFLLKNRDAEYILDNLQIQAHTLDKFIKKHVIKKRPFFQYAVSVRIMTGLLRQKSLTRGSLNKINTWENMQPLCSALQARALIKKLETPEINRFLLTLKNHRQQNQKTIKPLFITLITSLANVIISENKYNTATLLCLYDLNKTMDGKMQMADLLIKTSEAEKIATSLGFGFAYLTNDPQLSHEIKWEIISRLANNRKATLSL